MYIFFMKSYDKIGFTFFSDKIIKMALPASGRKHFSRFVYELSNPLNYGGVSNLEGTINYLLEAFDKSISLVVLVSDFITLDKNSKPELNNLGSLFETAVTRTTVSP